MALLCWRLIQSLLSGVALLCRLVREMMRHSNNESSEVFDILLPVTFYLNPSTMLDNVKNF